MVGDYAHGHVDLVVLAVFLAREGGDFIDHGGEDVGIVVRCLPLQGHAEAFEAHAGVDYLCGKRLEGLVGFAVELHEHEVPYLDYLRVVLVDQFGAGNGLTFLVASEVDVYFRAGTAGSRVAHLPEIVVLVAVDDVAFGKVLLPVGGRFVVALETFGGRTFEHCGVEVFGIQTEHVNQKFPGPVYCLFLEVVAEAPVAEHFEHGVVVGVEAYFLQVVVFAAHAEAFLGVGDARPLRGLVAENDVFKLVHARVGKHQRGVVFDYHRCRRHNLVTFALEELLE